MIDIFELKHEIKNGWIILEIVNGDIYIKDTRSNECALIGNVRQVTRNDD